MNAPGTTLTLLFTDLVNSTELAASLGPAAQALRRAHDRILRDQFSAYGGNVVKNTGDGFFVTFSSAGQAVECAAAIQQSIAARQSEGRYRELSVRIGLHTGEPFSEDGDFFGVDVAAASRIMGQAAGGDVLLSEITYLLARSGTALEFVSEGSHQFKGLPEPVTVYRVLWEAHQAQPKLSRFVGRVAERARLIARLEAAAQGRGSIAFISGEPGVGKTRLAREICIDARDRRMHVLSGRAFDTEGLPPYHAVIEALRTHLRGSAVDDVRAVLGNDAAVVAKVMSELADRLSGLQQPVALTPEAERYRLFDAIAGVLGRFVADVPAVLFLDDLQWADRATVHLVQHLARHVAEIPLLILITYRDIEVVDEAPLTALVDEVERSRIGERIALQPLSREDSATLVAHVLGDEPSPDILERLYAAAEGNPFFTEELVRHLRDRLRPDATQAAPWTVPDSVRHVLLRRLERLRGETRDLLACCAAMGRDLTLPRIAAATGMPEATLAEALDDALEARVLREEGAAYSFAHPLIRQAVYDGLRSHRRKQVHLRVGAGLEGHYAVQIDQHVEELAHHYLESASSPADLSKAEAYARRAATQANAVFAYHEAAAYYRRAADMLERSPTHVAERCDLLLALGDMLTKAGEAPAADATFQRAAAAARTLDRPDLLGRAALGLGDVRRTGGIIDQPLIALLEEALASIDSADSTMRARLLARLTAARYHTTPLPELRVPSIEAAQMAERLGDAPTKVYVARSVLLFIHDQHDVPARLRAARELEALAAGMPDREAVLYARHMQIDNLVELGDIAEADTLMRAFQQEAQTLRQPFYLWLAAVYHCMRALFDGRWDEAEHLAQEAFALGKEAQTETNLAFQFLAAQLFALRLEQGRLAELAPLVHDFVRQYPALRWRAALAFVYSETGDEAAAREEFDAIATHDFVDIPDDFNQPMALLFVAELCARFDDGTRAKAVYERLLPFEGRNIIAGAPTTSAGAASRPLGQLAGVLRRWDDAERHFRDAVALNERMGARPLVARTQYAWACMLLRRRLEDDAGRAASLLDNAAATATDLNMLRLQEEIRSVRGHTVAVD